MGKVLFLVFLAAASMKVEPAFSDTANVTQLKEVVVTAKSVQGADYKPGVEGTKIYAGKKASVIHLEETPVVVNNNFRQVLEKTPGLLLSEESTPLFSVGYRGLDPHRAQFTQVLKDGIPIHADMFGYPEAYYVPPTQVVDHIDFIRGGGSLLYGPQPGGALNFVTKDPYPGAFNLVEENSFGSHDFYSNYSALSGTQGPLGYYGYFHHRQAQGFREFNSQYDLYYGGGKLVIKQDPTSHWVLGFDLYNEEHGEPGGLTRSNFDLNPSMTTRPMDHFELNRYAGSLGWEKELSEKTYLEVKGYGTYYERLSWRQRTSGTAFGTLSSGANASTNDIESQEFYTGGVDVRLRREYESSLAKENTLSGGVLYHYTTSPRIDKRGSSADALDGTIRKDSDRDMSYLSLFLENLFKWGRLAVTPGIRLENIWQSVTENTNLDKTTVPLADDSVYDFVALAGVGADYEAVESLHAYANFSQGYRPKIFTQAVPNGTNQIVNEDLKEGHSWQLDVGVRGNPVSFFSWDAGYFHMEFEDQIGSATVNGFSSVQNVGDARHQGIELTAEVDTIGLWDSVTGSDNAKNIAALTLFYNAMFLDAEFTGGPNTGKTPPYAPDFIQKGGIEYRCDDRVKIRFAGTFTDDHFANDTNTEQFGVPSYKVWDLTGEFKIYKDWITVFAGINNVFDEHYFARARSDGIDPADGRNYFGGMRFVW